jgi:hypothetical protein
MFAIVKSDYSRIFRRNLSNFLQLFDHNVDCTEFTKKLKNTINNIKHTNKNNNNNSVNEATQLIPIMKQHLPNLSSTQTADWMWLLNKLGFAMQNTQHKALIFSLLERFIILQNNTTADLSRVFYGASKVELKWKIVPYNAAQSLMKMINLQAKNMIAQEISITVYSFFLNSFIIL